MNDVLGNVKVGDKLLVQSRYATGIETVVRTTTTLVITDRNGKRFRKNDGLEYGSYDPWNRPWARLATPEDLEQVKRKKHRQDLLRECKNINYDTLSTSQLEKILEIAKSEKPPVS